MVWLSALATGLAAGLASVPHCAAMCGPVAALACGRGGAASRGAVPQQGLPGPMLQYQAGRLLGYGMLGLLAGQLGEVFSDVLRGRARLWLPMVSAASLLWIARRLWSPTRASGLVVLGRPGAAGPERQLGHAGEGDLGQRLLRILPADRTALGALSALLPCGALYAAVLLATATATPISGVALMLGFAVTSGLALVLTSAALGAIAWRPGQRAARLVSVALLVGAVLMVARPVRGLIAGEGAEHGASSAHTNCH